MNFVDWWYNEPNNYDGDEDCVMVIICLEKIFFFIVQNFTVTYFYIFKKFNIPIQNLTIRNVNNSWLISGVGGGPMEISNGMMLHVMEDMAHLLLSVRYQVRKVNYSNRICDCVYLRFLLPNELILFSFTVKLFIGLWKV